MKLHKLVSKWVKCKPYTDEEGVTYRHRYVEKMVEVKDPKDRVLILTNRYMCELVEEGRVVEKRTYGIRKVKGNKTYNVTVTLEISVSN